MARNYGVVVKAFNVSHEQIVYARERAAREGLASRVQFIEDDYRNAYEAADVFVSIGMLEHVGREHFGELGNVIQRTIGDVGRGLLHFIGRSAPRPLSGWIRKRIFPGAYPPSLRESLDVLEPFEYSVLDVENLRPHYMRTLSEWLHRFEHRYADIAAEFGEEFARTWRLYLAGSYVAFRTGTLQLFQVTFAGRNCKDIPMTRDHLYTPRTEQAWSTGT
jgi:cyclopropane-fatty-acyl-phospholipid synthase